MQRLLECMRRASSNHNEIVPVLYGMIIKKYKIKEILFLLLFLGNIFFGGYFIQ